MSRPASQISNLENKVIQELKSEVLQFRKSTDEKTSMETRNIHGDEKIHGKQDSGYYSKLNGRFETGVMILKKSISGIFKA